MHGRRRHCPDSPFGTAESAFNQAGVTAAVLRIPSEDSSIMIASDQSPRSAHNGVERWNPKEPITQLGLVWTGEVANMPFACKQRIPVWWNAVFWNRSRKHCIVGSGACLLALADERWPSPLSKAEGLSFTSCSLSTLCMFLESIQIAKELSGRLAPEWCQGRPYGCGTPAAIRHASPEQDQILGAG
jgi:hypothetical protein